MSAFDHSLKDFAQERLRARAVALDGASFGPDIQFEFTLSKIKTGLSQAEINAELARHQVADHSAQPAIYVLTLGEDTDLPQFLRSFHERDLPRFAAARVNLGHEQSRTLYVGSSAKVARRLREHLWRAPDATYALHLSRWCSGGPGSIRVNVRHLLGSVTEGARQDLEDTLWHQRRPLFGKSGGR